MEWVEISAPSIEQARDLALDRLGVDLSDAEIEVLAEAGSALFGLRRTDARVRARVRPTAPPPRQQRNDRRRSRSQRSPRDSSSGRPGDGGGSKKSKPPTDARAAGGKDGQPRGGKGAPRSKAGAPRQQRPDEPTSSVTESNTSQQTGSRRKAKSRSKVQRQEKKVIDEISLEDQGAMIVEFIGGLVEAFDLPASAEVVSIADDAIEVAINGESLGLLIGPGGNTLSALGEVTKTVLQRRTSGASRARVRLDVAGYRERRRSALAAFTLDVAASVVETGESRALEPMHSADRKVVHDSVSSLDGVGTISDGDEPRRRVVLVPEG